MSQEKPRFLLIVFIALSQFSSAFMHAIMGVTLPAMGQELAASGVELALTESIFLATTAALLLPIGRFADATDKNTLFKGGLIGLAVLTFAIGLQPSITTVIGARFLQGVAAAFLTATSMAIVADLAPRNQMGRMLGLAIGATYFGLASGPFFSGLITTHLGWRWVFFLAAVPPMLAYLLSRSTLTSRWRPPTTTINLWNSLTLAASIMVFVAGAAMLKRMGIGISLTALGIVIGVVFLFLERRAANPLLKIDEVIANHSLSNALSVQFLIYCGTVGTTFLLSVYLQLVRGHSPEAAGHLLVIGPVVMAIFAPLAGRVSDRISPRLITALGAALILCSVALAALDYGTVGDRVDHRDHGVPGTRFRAVLGPEHRADHEQRGAVRSRHGVRAVGGHALARHGGQHVHRDRAAGGAARRRRDRRPPGRLPHGDALDLHRVRGVDGLRRPGGGRKAAAVGARPGIDLRVFP